MLREFAFLLKNHFAKLVTLNLLFLLCCIPIVTIPAAFSGLCGVLMPLVREGTVFEWKVFFAEFKIDFLKRVLFWLPLGALNVLIVFIGVFTDAPLLAGISIVLCIFSSLVQAYWYPMMVLLNVSCGACLKNAIIITLTEWRCNLCLLPAILISLVLILFFPITIGIILFGSGFLQLYVCIFVNKPIQSNIIEPFYMEEANIESKMTAT